jgi:hypothetical protein
VAALVQARADGPADGARPEDDESHGLSLRRRGAHDPIELIGRVGVRGRPTPPGAPPDAAGRRAAQWVWEITVAT